MIGNTTAGGTCPVSADPGHDREHPARWGSLPDTRRPRRPSRWAAGWGRRHAPSRFPRPHRTWEPVTARVWC